ncbi:MAG: methylmalonyl Co-A mutase-associated GTPase MeaB [Cyclobacteriaceae bacterium]|nr:methylmalonyl Co-A mutase-associated GTPase MeaB [Cyclobacteriaceae bacterium]
MYQAKKRLSVEEYVNGVLKGDIVILSKSITLVESTLESDHLIAEQVIERLLPHTGNSIRIGITGVPGVGKSTFIESFGKLVTSKNKKLAVLAIDPSSQRSKGSILGDKTRMAQLAVDPLAFIRPSASGSSLGGVSTKTRETMLLCEAAGFEVIFIETVGVGQSETTVKEMVDFFLLLMLAGAGDELQGIKKGIMEMADAIAITKADGDNKMKCDRARRDYKNALHLFPPSENGWYPPVLTCSALTNEGLDNVWQEIEKYASEMQSKGYFMKNRQYQNVEWMHDIIMYSLRQHFYANAQISHMINRMEKDIKEKKIAAISAARTLLSTYHNS